MNLLLDKKGAIHEIWAIRIRLQLGHRARDLALFNLDIYSKLRGRDLVGLRVLDVMQGNPVPLRSTVLQKKTQRPVQHRTDAAKSEALKALNC